MASVQPPCEGCARLQRSERERAAAVVSLTAQLDRCREREQLALGEAEGLRTALEESHARLCRDRERAAVREADLADSLRTLQANPSLEATVASLRLRLDEKNAEYGRLLGENPGARRAHDLLAAQEMLREKEGLLRHTQLELLKYKRRCDELEAVAATTSVVEGGGDDGSGGASRPGTPMTPVEQQAGWGGGGDVSPFRTPSPLRSPPSQQSSLEG